MARRIMAKGFKKCRRALVAPEVLKIEKDEKR